jgi:carbonic anhydrase
LHLPKSLIDGHFRFRREIHAKDRGRYLQLAELGQTPTAMVIACCDARVDVSAIFDAEPGALFILRNVANLVPPYEPHGKYHGTSAAIEFAALALKVPHIIVLGLLALHGLHFDIASGELNVLDEATDSFAALTEV